MFIELLDGLRCTSDHPQIPLVAAIAQRDGRMVTEGVLGCPTCRREYQISGGAVAFDSREELPANRPVRTDDAYDPDGAMRAGAFLAASDGATVALVGEWARYAAELAELIALRVYAVNPAIPIEDTERVGTLHLAHKLAFADSSLRGVAIGEAGWSARELEAAARSLAPSGRMVAPADATVPSAVAEIARDERFWVAEKRGPLVTLHRR